jgi:hypothetical protein
MLTKDKNFTKLMINFSSVSFSLSRTFGFGDKLFDDFDLNSKSNDLEKNPNMIYRLTPND